MPENTTQSIKTKDLVVTRVFDAPVALVWKAWTDPKHVMRWWGPNYFTSPSCKMDFREGGKTIVCMRAPDGQDHYSAWIYQKIVPLERIEYIQNLTDSDGNKVDPVKMGLRDDFPQDVRTVITFRAIGEKTEMTIGQYGFPDSQMFEFAEMGLNQSLDKMAATFSAT
ncbi:MAG: SRPBCC domain-containing protein [Anaerolineae bacterium]|nr:SRPBCC domain-containing protein [Anaerolineae bacterium]